MSDNPMSPPSTSAGGPTSRDREARHRAALPASSPLDHEAQVARHEAPGSLPRTPPRELAPNHQGPIERFIQSDRFIPQLSTQQHRLLELAADGPVTHARALTEIYNLTPRVNRRGRLAFDRADAAAPRTALTTSLQRLERRGLIHRSRHGYRLATHVDVSECSTTTKHTDSPMRESEEEIPDGHDQ